MLDTFAVGKFLQVCGHDGMGLDICSVEFICGSVHIVSQSCEPKWELQAHMVDVGRGLQA